MSNIFNNLISCVGLYTTLFKYLEKELGKDIIDHIKRDLNMYYYKSMEYKNIKECFCSNCCKFDNGINQLCNYNFKIDKGVVLVCQDCYYKLG
jgi:hypothetical protein